MSVEQLSRSQVPSPSQGRFSRFVKDRRGKVYQLFIAVRGDRHCLQLYDRAVCVGEARCSWQGEGRMVLDDIAIANEVDPVRLSAIKRWAQRLLSFEFEPVCYRQRGLGTALLESVIAYVQVLGAVSLQGEVFQADLENNPELLNWYISQGFAQSSPRPEQADVLANIVLALPREESSERALPLQLRE